MDVAAAFRLVESEMQTKFERIRASVKHAGVKGQGNECVVKNFLRDYLPRSLGITSGEIIDSSGGVSKQCDVIIYDEHKTPVLYSDGQNKIVPIECVYAIIEVKAIVDATTLTEAHQNMLAIKRLEKVAYYKEEGPISRHHLLYGRSWLHWPVMYFLFGFETSMAGLSIVRKLYDLDASCASELHQRIDSALVLGKGIIANIDESDTFDALPSPNSSRIYMKGSNGLFLFHLLLSHYLNQVEMDNLRLLDYGRNIDFRNWYKLGFEGSIGD